MNTLNQILQEELFSPVRLRGYANMQEHEDNFKLIGTIAHKIGILELVIRNKIDSILLQENAKYLETLPKEIEPNLPKPKENENENEKTSRDKIVSMQNLGFWIKLTEYYKIHNKLFDMQFLQGLDLKRYCEKNKNHFNKKVNLRNYQKAKAILELLRLIRNRAFHIENLYKITGNGYPRLNVKITNVREQNLYIAIEADKIKIFLNDILASFHKDLVYYAEK